MGRPKKIVDAASENLSVPEADVTHEVVETKVKYPEVARSGKFQMVKIVGDQYAIYNPDGARVSMLVSFQEASDIVRAQNLAGHLK
jgi:hypothetical protein